MFVQYSFVQKRHPVSDRTAFDPSPSVVVATGIGCMALTALLFLLG